MVSCGQGATNLECSFNLTNTGSANAAVTAVNIQAQGKSNAATCAPALPQTVPAGGSLNNLVCTTTVPNANEPAVGAQATGTIVMSNGANVAFAGTWN